MKMAEECELKKNMLGSGNPGSDDFWPYEQLESRLKTHKPYLTDHDG